MRQSTQFWAILALVGVISGCSGYRYTQTSNPLQQYGVNSLSVPMFYNFSSVPEVSSNFTRETYKLLSGFGGLKLHSGWSKKSDAVLIGIVRSEERMSEVLQPQNLRVAQGAAEKKIGDQRLEFYVPGSTRTHLSLQVVVVKRPTAEELALLQSDIGEKVLPQGKILFNERFSLDTAFNREIFDGEATSVVGTQNAGALRRAKDTLAQRAAEQIRDMILYAF
jgi:hypothetical protein